MEVHALFYAITCFAFMELHVLHGQYAWKVNNAVELVQEKSAVWGKTAFSGDTKNTF